MSLIKDELKKDKSTETIFTTFLSPESELLPYPKKALRDLMV